ncbi:MULTISPECIES: hypothetical protein [unclassified Variovorax]|uniref:hypothetical protein n=2 Tax=Variovorax TaxID=34072 RepID=UPI001E2F781F|nr:MULTISPECIES: hypothetical protein [unclassified Variovorax]
MDTTAFFAVTAGSDPAAGVFGRVLFLAAFEARAVVAARPFLAGDFFTGGLTAGVDAEPAADPAPGFTANFFREAFAGRVAGSAGAATAAAGDAVAAADVFLDLPFAEPARDWIRLGAAGLAGTFVAGDSATGATAAGAAAPIAKLSSVRPAAMASRSHAGLGPRPPHWWPCPSLNFAPLAAARPLPFVALVFFEAEGDTAVAEVEANFRSPAVRPYVAIMSLIFAMAPLASIASCF